MPKRPSVRNSIMSQFLEQYGDVSFDWLVSERNDGGTLWGSKPMSSGSLVEQMRKQAYLNQQTRDEEEDLDAEWEAIAQMQKAEYEEAESINDQLLSGAPRSQPSSSSNVDPEEEAKAAEEAARAAAVASYRAAERAIREAVSDGQDIDEATRRGYLAAENHAAVKDGIKWRDRGPRGEGAPKFFKGQKWRESSQRYSTRGGHRQKEFADIFSGQKGKKGGGKNSKGGSHAANGGGDSNRKGRNKGSKAGGSQSTWW